MIISRNMKIYIYNILLLVEYNVREGRNHYIHRGKNVQI